MPSDADKIRAFDLLEYLGWPKVHTQGADFRVVTYDPRYKEYNGPTLLSCLEQAAAANEERDGTA